VFSCPVVGNVNASSELSATATPNNVAVDELPVSPNTIT
jgi:hypothetical protein